MRTRSGMVLIAGLFLVGCFKGTSATADSPAASSTASGTIDKNATRAEILAADSAFVRATLAKNVDSLMPYYDESVVSMGEGGKAVKGLNDVRASYTQALKGTTTSTTTGLDFESGGVNFSDDGTMAWDYGTYTSTTTDSKGKPVKSSGNFLNVWKRVGGHYKIVAEINNSSGKP